MQRVHLDLAQTPYDILIGRGLLAQAQLIAECLPQKQVVVISNTTVAPLYLAPLRAALEAQGIRVDQIILPDGEAYKSWASLSDILDQLFALKAERNTTLIALGGGVIGDITGFAAAIYQRGMPFIQVPTTLLAQVDSSVGGKTAINHPAGKNMIGAFYQPLRVISDLDVLASLPAREFSAGLAEVIKYGLIDDLPFLDWLERNMPALIQRDPECLSEAIKHACHNKARIVAADEREQGQRALLNLGHTFGHAIEAGLGYGACLHGEAVAIGMLLAAQASERLGWLGQAEVARVAAILQAAQLPVAVPELGTARWLQLMAGDKKVVAGRIRFVLLRGLGGACQAELSEDILASLLH